MITIPGRSRAEVIVYLRIPKQRETLRGKSEEESSKTHPGNGVRMWEVGEGVIETNEDLSPGKILRGL